MSKEHESAADRIWREKLDLAISLPEALLTILFAAAVASALIFLEV